jgi:predicted phage-related endonuclease
MSTFELQNKVAEIRELRRMAEELEAEITAIQDSIKDHMDAIGADELTGTDYKITWKTVTSSRLDSTALKKALPEIAERFTKTTSTRRFVLA